MSPDCAWSARMAVISSAFSRHTPATPGAVHHPAASRGGWRRLLALALAILATAVHANTITVGTGTLGSGGDLTSTTAGTYESAGLSASLTGLAAGTDVLVLSSFSAQTGSNPTNDRSGLWRLYDGSTSSLTVQRYLSGSNDTGVAGMVHLFENVSGDRTFTLQHATNTDNRTVNTFYGSMIAMPLTVNGAALNYGVTANSTAADAATQDVWSTYTSTTVTLPGSGKVLISAAINATSQGTSASRGEWRVLVDGVEAGVPVQRYMVNNGDYGAITLQALSGTNLSAGSHTITLQHRTLTSQAITTRSATLVAVGLTSTAGEVLPAYQFSNSSQSTTSPAVSGSFAFASDQQAVVLSSYNTMTSGGSGTATSQNYIDGTALAQPVQRWMSSTSDMGAAGNVGWTSGLLTSGTSHTVTLNFSGEYLGNANVVVLGTMVPEPGSALLVLGAMGILGLRRRPRRRAA